MLKSSRKTRKNESVDDADNGAGKGDVAVQVNEKVHVKINV